MRRPHHFPSACLRVRAGLVMKRYTTGVKISVAQMKTIDLRPHEVLLMLVMQKTREIGILVAMGATGRSLASVFALEALAFGVAGSALGSLGAYGLLVYFQTHPLGGTIQRVAFEPWFFWRAILFTMSACVLACYWPVRRAVQIDPVRAIRSVV